MLKKGISIFTDKIVNSKLSRDILWNYLSFGVLAVSGILMNVVIAGAYGAETLGVFNQVYAVFIIACQFAAAGVQFSALKHVAEFADDQEECNKIVSSAVTLSLFFGVTTGIIVFLSRDFLGNLLASQEVARGIIFVAPALVFFSSNTVLLKALNGLRLMKAHAFALSVRYLFMIGFVWAASIYGLPGYMLAAAFLVAESALFLVLFIIISRHISFVHWSHWDNWIKKHTVFGGKGLISGVLIDLNTRVDVLMLGFFLNDRAVGIYSFAALFAEGLFHFLIVIQKNFNPIIVKLLSEQKTNEIKSLVRRTQKILYPVMAAVVLLMIGLFPSGVTLLKADAAFRQSGSIFAVLSIGIFLSSGYIPFYWMMLNAGLPEYHTLLMAVTVGSNIILNALIIPLMGVMGAAVATSCSFVIGVVFLNILVKKRLDFSLR